MTALRRTSIALALVAALSPAAARAQHSPRTMTHEARQHFDTGTRYFQVGRFAEAATEFQQVYDATHIPEFLYNVAIALESANNLPAALDSYERYDAAGAPGLGHDAVQARIVALRTRTANAAPSTPPESATPAVTPPTATTATPPPAAAPPARQLLSIHTHAVYRRDTLSEVGPYALIGLGVIGGGIGIALGAIGLSNNSVYNDANSGQRPWGVDAQNARDAAGPMMTAGLITGIVGGALLVSGLAFLFARGPGERLEVMDAYVTPLPGGGAVAGIGGRL